MPIQALTCAACIQQSKHEANLNHPKPETITTAALQNLPTGEFCDIYWYLVSISVEKK
jgi:hypothetical protein